MFPLVNTLLLNSDLVASTTEHTILFSIFIFLGSMSVFLSLIFSGIIKYSFFKGMAVIFFLFGIAELLATRIPIHHFKQYWIFFLSIGSLSVLAGIFLFLKFHSSAQVFWKGLGLGLMIQGMVVMILYLTGVTVMGN